MRKIQITTFVQRQWDVKFAGTNMNGIWQPDFEKYCNEAYQMFLNNPNNGMSIVKDAMTLIVNICIFKTICLHL